MTLNFEQLMETDLKGYKFNDPYKGYTRSGFGVIDDYRIVLEDNGDTCLVADLETKGWIKTWSKRSVADKIAYAPLLKWNAEAKAYVNDIEQL
jgi:hypothetical protein